MRLILKYLSRYKFLFMIDVISVFGFALVELGIPTIIAEMIDVGVMNQDQNYILRMGVIMLIISLIGVSGTLLLGYTSAKISTSITRDIRNDIFDKAQTYSHSEFNKYGISSLITRTNNDAFQIQLFVNVLLRTALMTPVMFIVSFIMTTRTSLSLSLIIAATIPVIVIGVFWVAKKSEPISENQQKSLDLLNRVSRENLTGIRVIRAFNNDHLEAERFDEANINFTTYSKRIFKLMSYTQPIFFMLMNVAGIAIFLVAATQINAGELQVGKLVAFMEYLFHAMFSMMLFCTVFMMYPRARVSANRIKELMDQKSNIENPVNGIREVTTLGTIEFDQVSFVYPESDEAVLKDISFTAKKGETIAFIGSTGSGKSSLINLIPRFYDVSSGHIKIDDIDVRDFDLDILRNKIGFIPQKAMLFTGTIAENIRFGKPDASEEEMIHAAKVAQAYDFITHKPLGFEEHISENATNVSGGQKQRLSIARALVRKPDIYIFDDSFSALDFKTDAVLRKMLKQETKESIVMVVAQRISSIMDADQIVVLNEGKIVGIGKHKELLRSCEIYYEIASSQLSKEELAYE